MELINHNKIGLYIEKYYPFLLTVLYSIFVFSNFGSTLISKYINDVQTIFDIRDFVTLIVTVESILFGFLLTVLALTMQSESKSIALLKEADRFKDLLIYNKLAVYFSLISVVLSIAIYLDPNKIPNQYYISIWFGVSILSLLLSLRYVRLFFMLVKN